MKKLDVDELRKLAIISAMAESKLRDGRYKNIAELSYLYDSYIESRLEMLSPTNIPLHRGSFKTYKCTLYLITTLIDSLQSIEGNGRKKKILKRIFQKDYESVEKLREEFRKELREYKE